MRFGLTAPTRRVDVALEAGLEPFGQLGLILGTEFGKPVLSPDIRRLDADRPVGCQHPVEVVDHLFGVRQADLHSTIRSSPPWMLPSPCPTPRQASPLGMSAARSRRRNAEKERACPRVIMGASSPSQPNNDCHHRSEIGWSLPVAPPIPKDLARIARITSRTMRGHEESTALSWFNPSPACPGSPTSNPDW